MMNCRFHPAVDLDYLEAYGWYENRSFRAARGFEVAVQAALIEACTNSLHYAVFNRLQFRRCPLSRYPISLVYLVEPDHIFVVSIDHSKRDQHWKGRRTDF